MINAKTAHFIEANRLCDPLRLALGKAPEGVDLRQTVEQIAGWQRARKKLPTWAAIEGVLFPPHLNIEQCSSESAARYKREIVERLQSGENATNSPMKWGKMVDLTAGYGVDFTLLSGLFERADYVERDVGLCELARHNLPLLGAGHASVVCGSAEEYLEALAEPVDLIFIDPARRDDCGRRTYAIGDCRPDVLTLLPQILSKTRHFIVKLSPMLDHREAVRQLGAAVSEVHIVATGGEVRETLVVMSGSQESGSASTAEQGTQDNGNGARIVERCSVPVTCWADGVVFTAPLREEGAGVPLLDGAAEGLVGRELFVPNAAVMKSGAFTTLCSRFAMVALDRDTHVFVTKNGDFIGDGEQQEQTTTQAGGLRSRSLGDMAMAAGERRYATELPGKRYRVVAVSGLGKRELREALRGVERCDVSVRNFPLSAEQLRSRLRGVAQLGEGGTTHVLGLTVAGRHVVAVTEK